MTTHDAILCSILSAPQDDLPRMVYADFLEESGDAARSEFIRVQVELARIISHGKTVDGYTVDENSPMCDRVGCNLCQLRRREEELVRLKLFPTIEMPVLLERWVGQGNYRPDSFAVPHRGFISSVRCSWQDWLAHHAALYWNPKQTLECRCRGEYGEWNSAHCRYRCESYPCDPNTGRVPRPFVPTAQPLESLRLMTWPGGTPQPTYTDSFQIDAETRFDRVKCVTCDGWHLSRRVHECKECGGIDKNEWTCDRWPWLVVEMPEEQPEAPWLGAGRVPIRADSRQTT